VDQFKVFRAIGLAFKAWFANFIPITLLAAVLYAPVIYWLTTLGTPTGSFEKYLDSINHGVWLQQGLATLIAPMLTYRVIQYMNGQPSSMITSIKFGLRGILPAAILATATTILNFAPMGGIIGIVLTCLWFVAAPAAVVERLNPITALSRSGTLTSGRRWPIFGLCFLIGVIVFVIMLIFIVPAATAHDSSGLRNMVIAIFAIGCVSQVFMGIVQAVSYSLLRGDKDGVTNEELAKVFE
jgi:hypothetical protein